MISGETVVVEYRTETGTDDYNAAVYSYTEETVEDVLVSPGPRSDIADPNRPDGVVVRYNLHFPKGFDKKLKGLRISVRGEWLDVIGDPDHYTLENTPGKWWMPVEVGIVRG